MRVRVKKTGLFGDRYVMAVFSESSGEDEGEEFGAELGRLVSTVRAAGDRAKELEEEALRRVQEGAKAQARDRQRKGKDEPRENSQEGVEEEGGGGEGEETGEKRSQGRGPTFLTFSGNDFKVIQGAGQLCGIMVEKGVPHSSILYSLADKLEGCSKVEGEVSLPSLYKPEFYEYARGPGEFNRKFSDVSVETVHPLNLLLSIAGVYLSRVGSTKFSRDSYVNLHLFKPGVESASSLFTEVKGLNRPPGASPETALVLWIARSVAKVGPSGVLEVVLVKDGSGQNPSSVVSSLKADLSFGNDFRSVLQSRAMQDLLFKALKDNDHTAINMVNLLYSYFTGRARKEDIEYLANRDLMIMHMSKSKRDENYQFLRNLRTIYEEIVRSEV